MFGRNQILRGYSCPRLVENHYTKLTHHDNEPYVSTIKWSCEQITLSEVPAMIRIDRKMPSSVNEEPVDVQYGVEMT